MENLLSLREAGPAKSPGQERFPRPIAPSQGLGDLDVRSETSLLAASASIVLTKDPSLNVVNPSQELLLSFRLAHKSRPVSR